MGDHTLFYVMLHICASFDYSLFYGAFSILHMINSIFLTMCVYRYLVVNFYQFFFVPINISKSDIPSLM